MQLSAKALAEKDSRQCTRVLHAIGDFERMGDHAVQLQRGAEELHTKKISFSPEARHEAERLKDAVSEIVRLTVRAFKTNDIALAQRVEPLEQVIDDLLAKAKSGHIERLQSGKCTIQMGFVQADMLTNFRRISDHCSNIAVAVIELQEGAFETHQYLTETKESGSNHFAEYYQEYSDKYWLR